MRHPGRRLPRLTPVLILLPPSEAKTPPRRGRSLDPARLSFPELTPLRERVVADRGRGQRRSPTRAAVLGVSPNLVADIDRNTRLHTAPTATAARHLHRGALRRPRRRLARRRPRSAAPTAGSSSSPPSTARCASVTGCRPTAVNMAVNLPGVGPLAAEWRKELAEVLDAAVRPRELVVDCRSSTYAAAWRPHGRARRALGAGHASPARRTWPSTPVAWWRASSCRRARRARPQALAERLSRALRGRADARRAGRAALAAGRDARGRDVTIELADLVERVGAGPRLPRRDHRRRRDLRPRGRLRRRRRTGPRGRPAAARRCCGCSSCCSPSPAPSSSASTRRRCC